MELIKSAIFSTFFVFKMAQNILKNKKLKKFSKK